MMKLYTNAKPISDLSVQVAYQTHGKAGGVVTVNFEEPREYMDVCAELAAIRFLLIEAAVCGVSAKGSGFKLIVSRSAIRKIAIKDDLSFAGAHTFAGFLRTRLSGCKIETAKKRIPEVEMFDRAEQAEPTDESPYIIQNYVIDAKPIPFEPIDTTVGTLLISKHAIDQYLLRNDNGGNIVRPWDSISKQLRHPELRETKIPDEVMRHKIQKYQGMTPPKVLNHPLSNLYYVVVDGVIVTTFTK